MKNYTNNELEEIAIEELRKSGQNGKIVDIDMFIEAHLGLDIEHKQLLDNINLAMLVIDPIKVVTKIADEDNDFGESKEIVLIGSNTVVINDNEVNLNEGALRFSMAHEAAHWILHRDYSRMDIQDKSNIEKEANFLAAALLMPKEEFKEELGNIVKNYKLNIKKLKDKEFLIEELSNRFKVSRFAAKIRFENLTTKDEYKSSQICVQNEQQEEINKKKKSPSVNIKTCLNQQVSFEITSDFLEDSYAYENKINTSFVETYETISKCAREKGIDAWKVENLMNIPKGISQIEPYQFIAFDKDKNTFYSLEELSVGTQIRINERFKVQLSEFVKKNKLNVNLDKLDFSIGASEKVNLKSLSFNEELIKIKIIQDISSKELEYANRKLKMLPCYNVTSGIETISDLIEEVSNNGWIRRYAFVIQPNIVEYEGEKYFEPKIVFRRFISSLLTEDSLGTQYRTETNKTIDLNRTIFIKDEDRYITVRIAKNKEDKENSDENKKSFKQYYKDYYIFNEIKENLNIGIEEINSALLSQIKNSSIMIAYHSSMGKGADTKIGAGVHSNDKILIKDHILKSCEKLKLMEPFRCIDVPKNHVSKINAPAIDQGKLDLGKLIVKNKFNEIDVYVFREENSKFKSIDYVRRFMGKPSEIEKKTNDETDNKVNQDIKNKVDKDNKYVNKINEDKYEFKLYNKSVTFNIKDVVNNRIVGRKTSSSESYEERKDIILGAVGETKENSIALLTIDDLRGANRVLDAKGIIRKALNSIGLVNQFIINEAEDNEQFENKVRSSILDLFNDIAFTNGYSNVEGVVIYSFWCHKIDKKKNGVKDCRYIPFIIRMDSENIEFMPLEGENVYEWIDLLKANKVLSNLNSWLNSCSDLEKVPEVEIINEIIEEINADSREKIVIISHQNNLNNQLIKNEFEKFVNATVVETNVSTTELIQTHEKCGNTGITKCIYRLSENHYRSYGEKVIGMQQNSKLYKYDNSSIEYKHRNLFDIKIIKSNMNTDLIAEIVHRLRVPLTTKVHLNVDMLTEHLMSFQKHLERKDNKYGQ